MRNCILRRVTIGSRVLFGPNVQIYTAAHPLAGSLRNGTKVGAPATGRPWNRATMEQGDHGTGRLAYPGGGCARSVGHMDRRRVGDGQKPAPSASSCCGDSIDAMPLVRPARLPHPAAPPGFPIQLPHPASPSGFPTQLPHPASRNPVDCRAVLPTRPAHLQGPEYALPISIGDDVWVGGGAIVLPGVSIGNGCE